MKHYKKRVAKITDELITYCFSMGAKDINIDVKITKEHYRIHLITNFAKNAKKKVDKLIELLNSPKHEELEEYYWELTGEGDVDNELSLVGMMVDKFVVDHQEDDTIELTLLKKK